MKLLTGLLIFIIALFYLSAKPCFADTFLKNKTHTILFLGNVSPDKKNNQVFIDHLEKTLQNTINSQIKLLNLMGHKKPLNLVMREQAEAIKNSKPDLILYMVVGSAPIITNYLINNPINKCDNLSDAKDIEKKFSVENLFQHIATDLVKLQNRSEEQKIQFRAVFVTKWIGLADLLDEVAGCEKFKKNISKKFITKEDMAIYFQKLNLKTISSFSFSKHIIGYDKKNKETESLYKGAAEGLEPWIIGFIN